MGKRRWWWVLDPLGVIEDKLDHVLDAISLVHITVWRVRMGQAEILASVAKISEATTNIAADIQRLKDQISTAMTPEQVAEVQTALDAAATALAEVAAVVPEPEPPPQ